MNAPPEISAAYIACTDKQRALALALAQGMGKEEAMLHAGYSKVQAHKCEKAVIEHPRVVILAGWYASQAMEKEADKVERAVDRMADIALFDPKSIHDGSGKVLPVAQWPESARSAFAGWDSMGRPKFWSPMDAAEKLFKVKGCYNEKVEHKHSGVVQIVTGVPRPDDKS